VSTTALYCRRVDLRHQKSSLPYRLVLNPNLLTVLLEAYGLDPEERIQTDRWLGTCISVTVAYQVIKSGKNTGQRKPHRVLKILEMARSASEAETAPRASNWTQPRDLVEGVRERERRAGGERLSVRQAV